MIKITGQITRIARNHEEYEQLRGYLYVLLTDAIKAAENTVYQPPRPIDDVDEDAEASYQEDCEIAQLNAERLAKKIFLALTGKKVIEYKEK